MKKLLCIILLLLCLTANVSHSQSFKMFGQVLNPHWSSEGLVFYWRGIEAAEMVDESFSMNRGAFVGGITWSGNSLVFNGSDSYVTMAQIPKSDAFTYIIRFKANTVSVYQGLLLNINGLGTSGRILVANTAKLLQQIKLDGIIQSIFSAGIAADTWYIAAIVVQDGDQRWYIDGVVSGTPQTFAGIVDQSSNTPLSIGRGFSATGWIFDGVMSDILYYNRALSVSEVQALTLNLNLPMQQELIWLLQPSAVPSGIIPIIQAHTRRRRAG